MTVNEWERVDGMIIALELDPGRVAEDLARRGVLAQLEWFDRSPQLLGVAVAAHDGAVATVTGPAQEPVPGPTVEELAESLAQEFSAEARVGGAHADHLPEGAAPLAEAPDEESPAASRIVEIGHTPASSVPLLAALEGIDIADLELPDGARALLAELPPERLGWNFGELPLVTLSMTGTEFQAFLVTDDHLENVVSHNWSMHHLVVPGSAGSVEDLPADVVDLVGDRRETSAIAAMVPGADAGALYDATAKEGPWAVRDAVAALGLPPAVGDFLLGTTPLDGVPGSELHLARGISNAIGRSVDIMLTEPDSPALPIWDAYHTTAVERPWIVRVAASVEAVVGASLLATAVRAEKPRSGLTKLGAVAGTFMVVDSVAELSLVKYLGLRAERRAHEDDAPRS